MRKKAITVMTTVCMVVGLLMPMITSNEKTVHAQTTPTRSIMLGLTGLKGGQASNVYMGTYPQSEITDLNGLKENVDYETVTYYGNSHYYAIEPIKWRVLDSTKGLLISDTSVDVRGFGASANWEGSELKRWLNNTETGHETTGVKGFKGYAFSTNEQATLDTDGISLLSTEEAENTAYFADSTARKALNSDYAVGLLHIKENTWISEDANWWLRSIDPSINEVALVDGWHGDVVSAPLDRGMSVRPALNLNPDSVLFTSAAGGVGEMNPISEYTGNDWKVTVKDATRTAFTASTTSSTTNLPTGGNLKVEWENAKTGLNEYVSVLLTDSQNNALYYENIGNTVESGSKEVKIPANLTAGDYKLRVFNEQKNGGNYTDYASEFKDIPFTVATTPTKNIMLGLTGLKGGQASNVYMGTYPQSEITDLNGLTENTDYETVTYDANPHYYAIEPIKWRVLDSTKGLLISDTSVDGRKFDASLNDNWDNSELKRWLNNTETGHGTTGVKGFKGYAFSTNEQTSIDDKGISLLSIEEVENTAYFLDRTARSALNSDYAVGRLKTTPSYAGEKSDWWLRSACLTGSGYDVAFVYYDGFVSSDGSYSVHDFGVRPALNLNLDSVLFTSAAVGGKSTRTGGAGEMNSISEYTGNDWKVTVKDATRTAFTASTTSSTTNLPTGGKIEVEWKNAKTGLNEYVSVLLTDSQNNALYYENIGNTVENGSKEVKIPANLTAGDYKLRVFNEQKNDGNYTDYASEFKDIPFTVSNTLPAKPTITVLTTNTTPASLDGTIEMTFSEEMDTTKGSVELGTTTLITGTWSNDNKIYTVPYTGLINSTQYTVSVSGFKSKLGGVMDDVTQNFTTVAKTPVLISSTSDQEFGEVTIDSSSLKTITISSDGLTGPIAYEVVGVDKSNFTVTKANSYSSASGGKLNITFIPTKEGKHTATLKLTSTGAAPITIDLKGVGKLKNTPVTPTPPAQGDTATPTSPKTGDSNNTMLYFGLLVISGIFLVKIKRRKALNK